MKVMVTGAAGYIGGETVLKLVDAGHEVLGIDINRPAGYLESLPNTWWSVNDFASPIGLASIGMFHPEAIIHCAGTSLVGPSIADPRLYYDNNFVKTKQLLDHLIDTGQTNIRFIFSSSAATYGNPVITPVQEIDPTEPISPYGQSKLMIDWMLKSYQRAYGIDFVSFRYFNACGADSRARHGQPPGATHIIARVLESVKNKQDFTLYGDNYPTPDGTCIRDYIHVEDLAQAHIAAIDRSIPSDIYNLGTNLGYSNIDVVQMATTVTKTDISLLHGPKREGDPGILTADSSKFMSVSTWKPQFNLQDIVTHAWKWYTQ
jgi:UDP-glucose-4-epimerase GalE